MKLLWTMSLIAVSLLSSDARSQARDSSSHSAKPRVSYAEAAEQRRHNFVGEMLAMELEIVEERQADERLWGKAQTGVDPETLMRIMRSSLDVAGARGDANFEVDLAEKDGILLVTIEPGARVIGKDALEFVIDPKRVEVETVSHKHGGQQAFQVYARTPLEPKEAGDAGVEHVLVLQLGKRGYVDARGRAIVKALDLKSLALGRYSGTQTKEFSIVNELNDDGEVEKKIQFSEIDRPEKSEDHP